MFFFWDTRCSGWTFFSFVFFLRRVQAYVHFAPGVSIFKFEKLAQPIKMQLFCARIMRANRSAGATTTNQNRGAMCKFLISYLHQPNPKWTFRRIFLVNISAQLHSPPGGEILVFFKFLRWCHNGLPSLLKPPD